MTVGKNTPVQPITISQDGVVLGYFEGIDFRGGGVSLVDSGPDVIVTIQPSFQLADSLSTLSDENATALPDGSTRFVDTLQANFVLDKTSTATVDGITVLATNTPAGRWLRVLAPSPTWTAQLTWYVDPATGNDENSGASALAPLKTLKEVTRRLRVWNASGGYVVNVLGDVPSTDAWVPSGSLSSDTPITTGQICVVKGQRSTLLASATTSASTASNPATNTQTTLIDTAVADFTPYIGKMVVTAAGTVSFVLAAPSANVATMSEWYTPDASLGQGTAAAAPGSGVAYTIVDFTSFAPLINPIGAPNGRWGFQNLLVPSTSAGLQIRGETMVFATCRVEKAPSVQNLGFPKGLMHQVCMKFAAAFSVNAGEMLFAGSALIGCTPQTQSLATLRFIDTTGMGTQIKDTGRSNTAHTGGALLWFSGKCGLFQWTLAQGAAVDLNRGARCVVVGDLYGSSTLGPDGVAVTEGSQMQILSTKTPTIAGTATQLKLEGGATAIPELAAGGAVPAASALVTWANWAAAPFSRNVMSYKTGSSVVSIA